METKIRLAKVDNFDIGIENHGGFFMFGGFNYEEGGWQGFGYIINEDFIRGILRVFNVEKLQDCNGKLCYVEQSHSNIHKVIPLSYYKNGKTFDVDKWSSNLKEPKMMINGVLCK